MTEAKCRIAFLSDFEREVLIILLKQASESAASAEDAVNKAITAYRSLSSQLQSLSPEKRLC